MHSKQSSVNFHWIYSLLSWRLWVQSGLNCLQKCSSVVLSLSESIRALPLKWNVLWYLIILFWSCPPSEKVTYDLLCCIPRTGTSLGVMVWVLIVSLLCDEENGHMSQLRLPSESTPGWVIETTEVYFLIVLEARRPRSRWRQGWFLARTLLLACRQSASCCVLIWPFFCACRQRENSGERGFFLFF